MNISVIDLICNICMALGGIGTVGTLIYMIADSKKRAKQLNAVQLIQSRQLEYLFEPDIRLASWSFVPEGKKQELVISNHGEDLVISSIVDLSSTGLLFSNGMVGWFPYNFDKNDQLHIPLVVEMNSETIHNIGIICSNKLGLTYQVSIHIFKGKPNIERPVLKY